MKNFQHFALPANPILVLNALIVLIFMKSVVAVAFINYINKKQFSSAVR